MFGIGKKKQESVDLAAHPFLEVSFKLHGKKTTILDNAGVYMPDYGKSANTNKDKKKPKTGIPPSKAALSRSVPNSSIIQLTLKPVKCSKPVLTSLNSSRSAQSKRKRLTSKKL
jgi:hypothetical protein